MKLLLMVIDVKPGDIVLSRGHWPDKTVKSVEHNEHGVYLTWTNDKSTRYGYDFEMEVIREVFHTHQA